jgi:DNA-binding transcriptional regulator GbsR (MarR family)
MTTATQTELRPVVRRFIEDAGILSQSLGVGRVIGQIYAFLYFSPEPRNLGDMEEALGISKGSASMAVRQLEQWEAVKKVWIKGDRKDYYEASDWFGRILKNAVTDTVGKKLASSNALLDEAERETAELDGDPDADFIRRRIDRMRRFQRRAQDAWNSPVVKLLLK